MHRKHWLTTLSLTLLTIVNPITHSNTLAEKTNVNITKTTWPPLPSTGFIHGRTATKADVDKRNAVFAYLNGKTKSTPVNIKVPQYGLVKHNKTGKMIKVIVLQAEKIQGQDMIGFMIVKSKLRAVMPRTRVTLLGSKIK